MKLILLLGGSDNITLEDILDRNEIPHDNHHHTLNCKEHCLAAEDKVKTKQIKERGCYL